jgi:hypothetical protein
MRAGPASTRIESAAELDSLLGTTSETLVLGTFAGPPGILGPKACRETFLQAAEQLRATVRFLEAPVAVANSAALFAAAAPFGTERSEYAIVLPPKWVAKGEAGYTHSSQFKELLRSARDAFPLVAAPTAPLVEKTGNARKLLACLLYKEREGPGGASRFRYVHKQLYRLVAAAADIASTFTFSIAPHSPLPDHLAGRFDHSAYESRFVSEWNDEASDFQLLVSEVAGARNYATSMLINATSDTFDASALAPFLRRIASGEEPPLLQGDEAPASVGLRTMDFGMGGDASFSPLSGAGDGRKRKSKRKAKAQLKSGAAAPSAKDEV